MKVLYHLAIGANGKGKDAALCDGNGKLWTVPYDNPTEFENEYMADKIVEHCHYDGIIIVKASRDRAGVHYDMEDARERALRALDVSIDACINDYVLNQMQDRVRMNFPPLPPMGRALECCIVRKYNLLKAGIRLVGWQPPYEMADPGPGNTMLGNGGNGALEARVNQLAAQLLTQNQLLLELLQGQVGQTKRDKPKPPKMEMATPPPPAVPEVELHLPSDAPSPDAYEQDQQAAAKPAGLRL